VSRLTGIDSPVKANNTMKVNDNKTPAPVTKAMNKVHTAPAKLQEVIALTADQKIAWKLSR